MHNPSPRCILASLILAATPLVAAPQQGQDPERQVASYERYLERKPYHDWAFEKLVEAAVAGGVLDIRVGIWRARLDDNSEDEAARVVLARLLAATDEWDEALATLEALEPKSGATYRLIGGLESKRGRSDEAAAAFGLAVAATEDPALLETLHGEHARALLAAGNREAAVESFRALAELRPDSFHLRVEAAAQLADGGLIDEAARTLDEALTLAGDDPEKRSRTLVELAKVHERRGNGIEAADAYWSSLELLGRGHWMRRLVGPRLVGLAQRNGTYGDLLERAASDASDAGDLAAIELHAEFLAAAGRRDEAREALRGARQNFPSDLALSRNLMDLLAIDDLHAERIELLQNTIAENPDELELYIELGEAFAADGRLDAARREWQRSLNQRVDDPGLCTRLAALFAVSGQFDDAADMFERAIALEPKELRTYGELAAFYVDRGQPDDAAGVLERAATAAAGSSGALQDLAGFWEANGAPDRAREALEAALALEPEAAPLLSRLAEMYRMAGEAERSQELLWRALGAAAETGIRRSVVGRIVRAAQKTDGLGALLQNATARLEADGTQPGPRLVLAALHQRQGQTGLAEDQLRELTTAHPDIDEAWLSLARLQEIDGAPEQALLTYERFAARTPQAKRRVLRDMARIHLAVGDIDLAKDCYEEILRIAPGVPAAWLEIADSYEKLYLEDDALRCVRQAVRLEPGNGATRLRLVDLYRKRGEWERAVAEVLAATGNEDPEDRISARGRYYDMLREVGEVDQRIEELRIRVQDNPYDIESTLTLVDVYIRESEFQLALETIDRLLTFQPREPQLLGQRATLLEAMDRWDEALEVHRDMTGMPDVDAQSNALGLARSFLELGDRAGAQQVLSTVRDSRKVARLYRKYSMDVEAEAALESALTGSRGDIPLLMMLASGYTDRGEYVLTLESLERVLAIRGESYDLTQQMGRMHHAAGNKEGTLAAGKRLFEMLRSPAEDADPTAKQAPRVLAGRNYNAIQNWFRSVDLTAEFATCALEELRLRPRDTDILMTVMWSAGRNPELNGELLETLELVREATRERAPGEMDAEAWDHLLWGHELSIYKRDQELAESGLERWKDDPARRAAILGAIQETDRALDALDDALRLRPDDIRLLSDAATIALDAKDWARARAYLEALAPLCSDEPDPKTPEQEAKEAKAEARRLRQLRNNYPRSIRAKLSDEEVLRISEIRRSRTWRLTSAPRVSPKLSAVRLALAKCRASLDDTDGAEADLRALLAEDATGIRDLETLGEACEEVGLTTLASETYTRLLDGYRIHNAHPVERYGHGLLYVAREAALALASIQETDDPLAAYALLAEWSTPEAARAILDSRGIAKEAVAAYRERITPMAEGEQEADQDPTARRNALVQLAETQQMARDWDGALASYREILEQDGSDALVWQNVALLHERAGRWEEAAQAIDEGVDAMRQHNRSVARGEDLGRALLRPFPPQMPTSDEDYTWNYLRGTSGYGGRFERYLKAEPFELRSAYASKLKILLDHRAIGQATETLRDILREDPAVFSWISYSLANLYTQYGFKGEGLPMLRLLDDHQAGNETLRWQYGSTLYAAGRLEEARPVLRKLVNESGVQDYYKSQARELLDSLESRLGATASVTLDDLREAVRQDENNVKKRVDLIARLKVEDLTEEAIGHALAAARMAPHMDEVQVGAFELLSLSGRDDEAEALLLEAVRRSKDDDFRVQRGVQLATWAWDADDREGAEAILEEAFDPKTRENYSPAYFYLSRGEKEAALRCLREDLNHVPEYRRDDIQSAILSIAGKGTVLEDVLAPVRESLLILDRPEALEQALVAFATALGKVEDLETQAPAAIAAAQDRGNLLGALEAAALEVALGDLDAARQRLEQAAAADPNEGRYLKPAAIRIARANGQPELAEAHLRELIDEGRLGKDAAIYLQDVGMLNERTLALAELGLVQAELGQPDAALETWRSMEEPKDETAARTRAYLAQEAGLLDIALAEVESFLADHDSRDLNGLGLKADLLETMGRWADLIPVLESWLVLETDGDTKRMIQEWLVIAHHQAGTTDQLLAATEAAWELDPDDLDLARMTADLRGSVGDLAGQAEVLKRLSGVADIAPKVLPTLLERALEARDVEETCDAYERLLASAGQSWEVRRLTEKYIPFLIRQGRVDRALEQSTASFPDKDSPEARLALVEFYEQVEDWPAAVLGAKAVLEVQPEDSAAKRILGLALSKLERWDELLGICLDELDEAQAKDQGTLVPNFLANAIEKTETAEELIQAAQGSDRATDHLVAYYAHRSRKETGPAVACLQEVLDLEPVSPRALWSLVSLTVREEQWDKALAAIEVALPAYSRLLAGSPRDYAVKSRVTSLRTYRAQAYAARGDYEALRASLLDRDGLRYDLPSTNSFRHGSSGQRGFARDQATYLARYERYADAYTLAAASMTNGGRWVNIDERLYRWRMRSGDVDGALRDLWAEIRIAPAVGIAAKRQTSTWANYGAYKRSSQPEVVLLKLAREFGLVEPWARRMVELAKSVGPDDRHATYMRLYALQSAERWEEAVALLEATVDKADDGKSTDLLLALAEAHEESGQLSKARDRYSDLEERLGAGTPLTADMNSAWKKPSVKRMRREKTRFRYAYQGRGGGGSMSMSYGGSTDSRLLGRVRRALASLSLQLGDRDRALAMEEQIQSSNEQLVWAGGSPGSSPATDYEAAGLFADAARVAQQHFDGISALDPDALRPKDHARRMAMLWRKAGDMDQAAPYVEQALADFDESLKKATTAQGRFGATVSRARFLLDALDDVEEALATSQQARADLAEAGEPAPRATLLHAEFLRRCGDSDGAWAEAQAAQARSPWLHFGWSTEYRYTLALLMMEHGDKEQARLLLHLCLAEDPNGGRAEEARLLLGG